MKNFYVYKHIRLDTGTVFYVGKGSDKRAWSKIHRNQYWHNIVGTVGYKIEIVDNELSEDSSFSKEKELIMYFKSIGQCETNMTDGGDGRSGFKWSKESIVKRTASVLGKPRANKGFRWNSESRKNLSKIMTGRHHKDSKSVNDISTGITYRNPKEACLILNLPWGSVYKMLKGERLNKTTLRYLENSHGFTT